MNDLIIEDFEDLDVSLEVYQRLSKDLKEAAKLMSREEARYLVDSYYSMQNFRTQAASKVRSAGEEPVALMKWVFGNAKATEMDMKATLGIFAKQYSVGQWLQGITGIGPVLSAGFLSTLDIRNCPTAGHWWRFSGLDPSMKWLSTKEAKTIVNEVVGDDKVVTDAHITKCAEMLNKHKETLYKMHQVFKKDHEAVITKKEHLSKVLSVRPWNARLKVLCFKAGECFVKVQNKDSDVYGKIFAKRKVLEIERNLAGEFKAQADKCALGVGKGTGAYKAYSAGLLPDAHIHARARRYAVKMFLSHLHTICYRDYYKEDPPIPYVFKSDVKCPKCGSVCGPLYGECTECDYIPSKNERRVVLGDHRHYIAPPKVETNGKSLRELWG